MKTDTQDAATRPAHTPGEWKLELVQAFPFGIRIVADGRTILEQSAAAHSSDQKTRTDCENGVGFDKRHPHHDFRRDAAVAAIAEQDANGRMFAAAPELLDALKDAEEELRLLRMKDTRAVYNPGLRAKISLVISKAERGQ